MNLISANHFTGNRVKQFSALKLSLSFQAAISLEEVVHKIVIERLPYFVDKTEKCDVKILRSSNVSERRYT